MLYRPAMTKIGSFTLVAALASAAFGCSGSFQGTGSIGPDANPSEASKAFFDSKVQPILEQSCAACHAGSQQGITFITPPDVYQSVISYPNLVIGGDAGASRLYAYGRSDQHQAAGGVSLNPAQAETVRQWIMIEPPHTPVAPPTQTTKFTPTVGENTVDLSSVASGLDGTSLTFTAQNLAQGIYITNLTMHAGAGGVHVKHPLFATYCPAEAADPVDSFYGIEMTVDPAMTSLVGGGTVVLVAFQPGCQISVHFETIEPGMTVGGGMDGGTVGGTGGGCQNVAGFTANAQAPLASTCGGCHAGGNAGAKASFDLSLINDLSPAGQAAVCGQVRGKLNLATPAMSILFQRVAPGQMTGHALTLNQTDYDSFRTPVLAWAVTEH